MSAEILFRAIFSALWLVFLVNVAWVAYLTRVTSGKQMTQEIGWLKVVAIAFAIPYFVGALLYALVPNLIVFLSIPLPNWFRLIMAGTAAVGVSFAVWGLHILGNNWAPP